MTLIQDHPQRYALANELHARPFPTMQAPGRVAFLALMPSALGQTLDKDAARADLAALLDRFGATHPRPDATHYAGPLGRHQLKWECHTEFVTYTLYEAGHSDRLFAPTIFEIFPADWLAGVQAFRVTSLVIEIVQFDLEAAPPPDLLGCFVSESLCVSDVLDRSARLMADFHIDEAGHMRFALLAAAATDAQRTGRIVQRMCEIETYKTMAMLGLVAARDVAGQMDDLADRLSALIGDLRGEHKDAEQNLRDLLAISARLEHLESRTSYRFGATRAYEAIVNQRIDVLREKRFAGMQTFAEFMMRRFDPAMRTVAATKARLAELSTRARRAGELLRTQVEVAREAQNQTLLQSMDKRADLQLRLQQTVEGLSVVAISYYAISIAGYLLYPLADQSGLSRGWLMAGVTVPVIALVWLAVRRIRKRLHP